MKKYEYVLCIIVRNLYNFRFFLNDYTNNFVNLYSFEHEILQQRFRSFRVFSEILFN